MWHDRPSVIHTVHMSTFSCCTRKKEISNAQLLIVASSGLIARESDSMPNIYPIGWYLFDASARFLAILICPQRVIDISRMIVRTIQRFYVKIAGRCLSVWEPSLSRIGVRGTISTPAVEWRGRLRSGRVKKSLPSFFRESYPHGKTALSRACESRPPSVLSKYNPTSIEYRAASDSNGRRRFVCQKRSRIFLRSFPSFVLGTSTKAESAYVLSNNWIEPLAECPLARYLSCSPYVALLESLFNPRPAEQWNHMSHGGTWRWNWSGRKHLD